MKKNLEEFFFNEAVKYLGKYPATRKKIREILLKKIKSKKNYSKIILPENLNKELIINQTLEKLDKLNIIDENRYLDSLFHYYERSLFSLQKIRNKLFLKGFDSNIIEAYISDKIQQTPDFELDIMKKFIDKKKLDKLNVISLKKKLFQQNFSENSIYRYIKE